MTLITEIPDLLFSSAIPDLVISTDGDDEVEVALATAKDIVFKAGHFPYNGQIKVYDLRSVVEMFMREQDLALEAFTVTAKGNGVTYQLCSFKVLYLEQRFDGDIYEFLRNNFLTNTSSKMTSQGAVELLYLFVPKGESLKVRYEIVTRQGEDQARLSVQTENIVSMENDRLVQLEISCPMIRDMAVLGDTEQLLAYSIHVGERAFTYYVDDHEPQVTLYCRNAFNVWERCSLHGVTTHKPKSERQVAVTNRISTFYNQRNEKQYEVETAGLTYEQAQWIEQLFYSHDVRMGIVTPNVNPGDLNPSDLPRILITDFNCEIHDRDGELNSVKFTYQFADRRTWLQTDYLTVDHERIFTAEYGPSFN